MTTVEGGLPRRRMGKILVPLILILLFLAGGGLAYYFGFLDEGIAQVTRLMGGEVKEKSEVEPLNSFVNMDEIVVNLPRDGGKQKFLKVSISLEIVRSDDAERVEDLLPRVRDSFEAFLRELRVTEIEGSRGIYRIREELLSRANLLVAPARVRNVLFRDLLIQ